MDSLARAERQGLCDTLTMLGPDAPTLCEGWDAHDLAVHIRLRETEPLAASGMFLPALAGHTKKRMRALKESVDFDELVELIRRGPSGVLAIKKIDQAMNGVEFFVHHEDLRRAGGHEVIARMLPKAHDDELWRRALGMAKTQLRSIPNSIILKRKLAGFPIGDDMVVTTGRTPVTVTGDAGELVLWMVGRGDSAILDFSGDPSAIAAVESARLSI